MVLSSIVRFLICKLGVIDLWALSYWICVIGLTGIVLITLKFAVRRKKYSELMPGYRVGFLDPLGNLNTISLKKSSRNGFAFHASKYMIQSFFFFSSFLIRDLPTVTQSDETRFLEKHRK